MHVPVHVGGPVCREGAGPELTHEVSPCLDIFPVPVHSYRLLGEGKSKGKI